jgi:hypothetical protein
MRIVVAGRADTTEHASVPGGLLWSCKHSAASLYDAVLATTLRAPASTINDSRLDGGLMLSDAGALAALQLAFKELALLVRRRTRRPRSPDAS